MAEKEKGEGDAKKILQECVRSLMSVSEQLDKKLEQTTPKNNEGKAPNSTSKPSCLDLRLDAIREQSRLFNFKPSSSTKRFSSPTSRSKKRVISSSNGQVAVNVRDTYTKEFVCLADKQQTSVPSVEEKIELSIAGLGDKKVVFKKDGNSSEVHSSFLSVFPQLAECGGYEILRTSPGSRQLIVVKIPPGGYTVDFLKSVLGQAKGYVRPIQKDLSLEVRKDPSDSSSPLVDCINCGTKISLEEIREHDEVCSGGSSGISKGLENESTKVLEEDVICVESESSTNASGSEPKIEESECYKERTEVLSNMFPNIPQSEIKEVVDVARDMDDAVNMLLDEPSKETASFVEKEPLEKEPLTLKILMKSHRIQLSEDETNRATIERDNLWCESIILFKSPKFKPLYPLRVRFTGEAGLDAGGLSREYSRLLQQAMFATDASLFEGEADRRLPIYSGDALHSNLFVLAGKMCAYLISHYDIGIPCLAPCAYSYISTGDIEKASQKCSLQDMPDLDLREKIKEVNDAKTKDDLENALSPTFSSALHCAGWVKVLTLDNKGLAMWQLIVHETLLKRKAPLDHFIKGLHLLNLLPMIRSHPELMSCYFLPKTEKLTRESIIMLFKNIEEVQEDEDSERARCFLNRAIKDLEKDEGEKGLQNFLKFMTGLEQVPPLGFSSPVSIEFNGDCGPTFFAETCLFVLKVPTMHSDYESFRSQFLMACNIGNAGFGSI